MISGLDEGALGRDGEGSQPVDLVGVGVAGVVALLGQTAVATLPLIVSHCRKNEEEERKYFSFDKRCFKNQFYLKKRQQQQMMYLRISVILLTLS